MPQEIYISKEELYDIYIVQNMTRAQCANHFGCSDPCIKIKIRKYGLQKPKKLENENKRRKKGIVYCENCGKPFEVETFRVYNSKYIRKNCSRECAKISLTLGDEHRSVTRAVLSAKRRARMQEAYDPTADKEAMREIYATARRMTKETGIQYDVDHIIPISKGGKHHQDNLQILTKTENLKKGTKIL
jgi:hypothetical protein